MRGLVSVIIPVYNVEQYLRRCLDSVITQTYPDLEIIIINDGSPDQSQLIIDEYAGRDDRIRPLQQENRTLGMARNAGLEIAQGEYLTFVDSDDYLEPDAIAIMVDQARRSGADIVVANNKKLDGVLRDERPITDGSLTPAQTRSGAWRFQYFIAPAYGITVWGKLYRHDFVRAAGVKFESNHTISGEDILFNLLLFTHDPHIVQVNRCLYVYCMNSGSITHSHRPRLSQRYNNLLDIYYRQLAAADRLDEFRDLLAFLVLRFVSTCCHNEYLFAQDRYGTIKEQLAQLMQSPIVRDSLAEVARGHHVDALGNGNKAYTRLQAALLGHGQLGLVTRLRMLRYRFM